MGKVIFVKNNKGGVGKSTISKNIAHGLALSKYKIALLSFDSQNDSLILLGSDFEDSNGIKKAITKDIDIKISIRENLDYYPLETDIFSSKLKGKLKKYIENLKSQYEFIIIDASPSKDSFLSKVGSELSDEILVPILLDKLSIKGISRLLKSLDAEKISYIVPNKYSRGAIEKQIFNELKEYISQTSIYLSNPLPESALEKQLAYKGKSIFETKSKIAQSLQKSYIELMKEMISRC